jgi:hypothetical protein
MKRRRCTEAGHTGELSLATVSHPTTKATRDLARLHSICNDVHVAAEPLVLGHVPDAASARCRQLGKRAQAITEDRKYGLSLDSIAERIGVSRERVRQMEQAGSDSEWTVRGDPSSERSLARDSPIG